jgi:exodeoxyribonuclease VII small subunit
MSESQSGVEDELASIAYVDAIGEVERILSELEGPFVDVDALAAKVSRAAALLSVCRNRIGRAREEVETVVVDLAASPGGAGAASGSAG